jgi:rhamnogalacturonyl hydrolase YesR
MCQALLPLQREDGFWNVSLLDPDHFGGKELTGTSLFVYGFAWGIQKGVLSSKKFLPAALKAWQQLATVCVRPDGSLAYVQGTGKEPKDGQPVNYDHTPDFEDYGLGCFLLAGTEMYPLIRK